MLAADYFQPQQPGRQLWTPTRFGTPANYHHHAPALDTTLTIIAIPKYTAMYQALRTSLWIDRTRQFVLRMDVSLVYDSDGDSRVAISDGLRSCKFK
jgi:hypothetical protein